MVQLKKYFIAFAIMVMSVIPYLCGAQMFGVKEKESVFDVNVRKMYHLFYTLEKSYVEELNYFNLVEASIKDVLNHLDPFAVYLTPEEVIEVKQSFYSDNNDWGKLFNKRNYNTVMSYTPPSVIPKVIREPFDELFCATPTSERKTRSSVDVAYMISPQIGYIKINRFSANTFADTKKALLSLAQPKSLILDLRGNGGGFLSQAIDVADMFLSIGKIITYTEGRTLPRSDVHSTAGGEFETGDVVVLVDEYTASASEMIAGALQDWDRATIVGRQTYGKGLVQQQIEFEDGSAMRVTIARYHTPCGRAIQKPYDLGAYAIRNEGLVTSKEYKTLTKGRSISSDGGIMPDKIISVDSSKISFLWAALVESGHVISKVMTYYSQNETSFHSTYPNFKSFAHNFNVPDTLIMSILNSGKGVGIVPLSRDMDRLKKIAGIQIKAVLAEKIWGGGSFYKILNMQQDNNFIQTAINILNKSN